MPFGMDTDSILSDRLSIHSWSSSVNIIMFLKMVHRISRLIFYVQTAHDCWKARLSLDSSK